MYVCTHVCMYVCMYVDKTDGAEDLEVWRDQDSIQLSIIKNLREGWKHGILGFLWQKNIFMAVYGIFLKF